jgi:hypothetical protein
LGNRCKGAARNIFTNMWSKRKYFGLPQEFLIEAMKYRLRDRPRRLVRFCGISLFMPTLNPLEMIERPAAWQKPMPAIAK